MNFTCIRRIASSCFQSPRVTLSIAMPVSTRWFAIVAIVAVLTASAYSQNQGFYRISGPAGTVIQYLSADGLLAWSNPSSNGSFLVETTSDVSGAGWRPLARGWISNTVTSLRVYDPTTPPGMRYIPGGFFTMGDTNYQTLGNVNHTVFVSPFYMDAWETTTTQVRDAFQWALEQGKLTFGGILFSNAQGNSQSLLKVNDVESMLLFDGTNITVLAGRSNHPCTAITWYGALAYCNFRSEIEGKVPCYNLTNWTCDFTKTGYRLPTESEWEKAARGGYEGRLFPWGDTITHSEANYRSLEANPYDISPTRDFHPIYNENRPVRTAPVGSFAPNNYGLHDVVGNVAEWCWDVAGRYNLGSTLFDPVSPEIPNLGGKPLMKGGNWFTTSERVLLASRYTAAPRDYTTPDVGLRVVLRALP